jgi:hypothetical protein
MVPLDFFWAENIKGMTLKAMPQIFHIWLESKKEVLTIFKRKLLPLSIGSL